MLLKWPKISGVTWHCARSCCWWPSAQARLWRSPDASSAFEFFQVRKNLLPRLDLSVNQIKKHRLSWLKLVPAERQQHPEMAQALNQLHCEVVSAASLPVVLELLNKDSFDLVIADVGFSDSAGADWLKELQSRPVQPLVVVAATFNNLSAAFSRVRQGAFDYVLRPASVEQLETVLQKAANAMRSLKINQHFSGREGARSDIELAGISLAVKRLHKSIRKVARSHATVLIHGASGTGKEAVAQALYRNSPRAAKPSSAQPFARADAAIRSNPHPLAAADLLHGRRDALAYEAVG